MRWDSDSQVTLVGPVRSFSPLVLMAVRCLRCIAEQGLDGVRGIGLVGVTAPWAERRERSCEACMIDGAPCNTPSHWDDRRYRPLGPIEPLRSVAERGAVRFTPRLSVSVTI